MSGESPWTLHMLAL